MYPHKSSGILGLIVGPDTVQISLQPDRLTFGFAVCREGKPVGNGKLLY